MLRFNHFNFNVKNLERSLKFYEEHLGLSVVRREDRPDKGFTLVFLSDGVSNFSLELTWLKDHPAAYDLGEQEYHLAFVADNFDETYKKHKDAGIVIYENTDRGIYFLEDPDGYWIEILPERHRAD